MRGAAIKLNKEKSIMKTSKILILLLALIMVASCFAGCGGTDVDEPTQTEQGTPTATEGAQTTEAPAQTEPVSDVKTGGTLVMSLQTEPISLNPDGNYDSANGYIMDNCFNKLLSLDNTSQVVNDLATAYEVSEDGLTYTFHLHENVFFSDGVQMTSDDVKFSFEQILAQGGQAATRFATIASIECPDANTVVFTTSAVDASFLYNIAYAGTYILPRHIYEGKDWCGADALQEPVGTGPFVFESWEKGSRITLVRNGNYFLGPELPYLDKVIFGFVADATTAKSTFLAGEYDILGMFSATDFEEFSANPEIVLEKCIYASRFIVEFNLAKEPYGNLALRQAVAYALNKDEMMSMALKSCGLVSEYWLGPLFYWAINEDVTVPGYDLEKAKTLMEQTGLTKDANGNYLSLTLTTMNYSPFPEIAEVFKSQMAAIGIAVEINMLEYASFDEKVVKNKDFDIAITSDYQGPEVSAIGNTVGTTGYLNCMGYSNAEVDQLIAQGVSVVTFEERAAVYQRLQEILAADMPYFPFSEWIGFYAHKAYVINHPASAEMMGVESFARFAHTWLDN
jgi:peptide/nickel transport system substrate-binding protein